MHPTADTAAVINLRAAARRVMPSVRLLTYERMLMELTSERAISDLDRHVKSLGFRLSHAARKFFEHAEKLAYENNVSPVNSLFLISVLETMPQFQSVFSELGGETEKAISILAEDALDEDFGPYAFYTPPYSHNEHRDIDARSRLIDLSLAIARRNLRREVFDVDIVEALFDSHEEIFPARENEQWADERLHTTHNKLAHFVGSYERCLDISLSDILKRMSIIESPKSPVEIAPASIRASVLKLLQDYPDYAGNCFLIMSFASTRLHKEIYETLKRTLKKHRINLLRADERTYSDALLTNVETYLHGCSFALAIFERMESEVFNPNVTFEVGYLYGLRKPVCLVKERTMPRLHSDLIGKLYLEFDIQDIKGTLPKQLEKWLKDQKII